MPMVKDKHLGGFVDGGDERCFYPQMWDWLIEEFKLKSVIDVGCGQGHALKYFSDRGLKAAGIDGSELVKENAVYDPIYIHDYTKGPYIPEQEADLIWSCEFVEHVEEKYIDNFIETFKHGRMVAMSHALPGQGGYHHVNEQDDEYWKRIMIKAGFVFADNATRECRKLAHDYFQRSGLVFINTNV